MTPHKDKLVAAIVNPKAQADKAILEEALNNYWIWIKAIKGLKSKGEKRVSEMVSLLNQYKDLLEVELISKKGSPFLKRQK